MKAPLPTGKTIYLWQIKTVANGNAKDIATLAQQMRLSAIFVKAVDGIGRYNLRPPMWKDDLIGPLMDECAKVGVKVWGWQYLYANNPEAEARAAARRMQDYPFEGWVIDAEGQSKGKPKQARAYMATLRQLLPDTTIGLTSYRFPTLHPELPWREFLSGCDFIMPQVYWAKAHNPADQLARCIAEYNQLYKTLRLSPLPMIPIGAAYHEHGWQPLPEEIYVFNQACIAHGLQANSWWEWGNAIRYKLIDYVIAARWRKLVTSD